ncbi:MAG: shikimate kinase, partial [Dehalococcoidia bacterium]
MPSPIGQRINIMGNTGCGKSTLGQQLADLLDVSFVELDAVNWLPNWVGLSTTDPDEFRRRL